MPSSPKIPRQMILESALSMLIRDGYSSLNIKTLAKELGCSTQPISWHFGNMEGLRKELNDYALSYANDQLKPSANNAKDAFEQVGKAYIRMASRTPNLFRFLYLDGYHGMSAEHLDALTQDEDNLELITRIANDYKISTNSAALYLQDTIVYTHGIAAMVATGLLHAPEEELMQSVNRAADAFLLKKQDTKD